MSTGSKRRRVESESQEEAPGKRAKLVPESSTSVRSSQSKVKKPELTDSSNSGTKEKPTAVKQQKDKGKLKGTAEPVKKRVDIRKLAPPKPFPAVAASASATGPRSAHKEGKNYICLTRKTSLGAYMRRCKKLIMDDGYKSLHLHAAGAAIPLLMQLSCALPPILPFSRDEIHTDITTGTVEVQDEVVPENEDEDITYRTRGKSTLYVVIRIGDGVSEKDGQTYVPSGKGSKTKPSKSRPAKATGNAAVMVYEEPEQEREDI